MKKYLTNKPFLKKKHAKFLKSITKSNIVIQSIKICNDINEIIFKKLLNSNQPVQNISKHTCEIQQNYLKT